MIRDACISSMTVKNDTEMISIKSKFEIVVAQLHI